MTQEVVRQMPKIMVQEVVKQIAAPAPVVVQQAPVVAAPIVETFAPAPIVETFTPAAIMSAPITAPIVSAPIVETFGAGYGTGIVFGAPVVETFGSTLAPSFATAPLVGSISAGLPMTTMAAPTMTTIGAPVGAIGSPFVGTSYGFPPTVC